MLSVNRKFVVLCLVACVAGGGALLAQPSAPAQPAAQPPAPQPAAQPQPQPPAPQPAAPPPAAPQQPGGAVQQPAGPAQQPAGPAQQPAGAARQAPTLTSPGTYAASFKALFILFVIALLLESGLAVVFNWRPFIEHFDARGVKTLVSFVFAYLFVELFNMDVVTSLVNIYQGEEFDERLPGKLVTALILAGGSAGVNTLMVGLGFRSVRRHEEVVPKPKEAKAWIAVKLKRRQARGPVMVFLKKKGEKEKMVGTIRGSSTGNRWLWYFLRDYGKFPTAGGIDVEPGERYTVILRGTKADGTKDEKTAGPYRFADRAIVDFEMEL